MNYVDTFLLTVRVISDILTHNSRSATLSFKSQSYKGHRHCAHHPEPQSA